MEYPTGIVRTFFADANGLRAVVDVDIRAACPRCASGKGCGAGLLTGNGGTRQITVAVPDGLDIAEGDAVEIALMPRDLLHAALISYGAPLLGAIVAVSVSYGMRLGDVEGAAAALAGLAVGMFASRLYLGQPACLSRFVPTVNRRLPDGVIGI